METQKAKCIITGLPVENYTENADSLSYDLEINNHGYRLIFEQRSDWAEFLSVDKKHTLTVWLWNKSWPIDSGVLLTQALIDRSLRQLIFPKDFDAKTDHFILTYYLTGGKEYKPFDYTLEDFLFAYAADKEEFERIIVKAEKNNWIEKLQPKTNGEY